MKHLPLNTRFLRPLLLLHRNPLRSWTHFRQSPLVDRVPDYFPWPVYLPRFELLLRVHWTSLEAIRCARIVYCYVPSRQSLRRYPFSNRKEQMCMHGVRKKKNGRFFCTNDREQRSEIWLYFQFNKSARHNFVCLTFDKYDRVTFLYLISIACGWNFKRRATRSHLLTKASQKDRLSLQFYGFINLTCSQI